MKIFLCLLVGATLLAVDSAEMQVAAAERAIDTALRNKDVDALDRLHADGYIHIFPSGSIATKAQALAALAAGRIPAYEWAKPPVIHIYGTTAVVTGRRHASDSNVADVTMTSVWVKFDDQWKRVSVITSPAPDLPARNKQ